jgi:1-acyl-sn-glycerol-3-phosphate acyltransferase
MDGMFSRHMAMTNEQAHALSRKRGTSWVYETARFVLMPIAKVWFRLEVTGSEYVPKEGPVIIAPNHKSFYDSFFVGLATRRHLHFMAKTELFEGRSAPLLSGLGAFPVRRGSADPDALETARLHLENGRVLALFPEGTRYRDPDALRAPRKGAGRLAIEARAPIVPCAISGTERLFWKGWFPRPIKIQVSFAPAIEPAELEATPEAAADLIQNQVWPEVEREFKRLRANPGLVAAVLAALSAGAAGGGIAYRNAHKPSRTQAVLRAVKLNRRKKKRRLRR